MPCCDCPFLSTIMKLLNSLYAVQQYSHVFVYDVMPFTYPCSLATKHNNTLVLHTNYGQPMKCFFQNITMYMVIDKKGVNTGLNVL